MMIKSNGFEFWDCAWSKGAWELKYTGEEKHMIIPGELIAQAGEDVETVRLSSETKDLESIYIPENVKDVWMGTLYATNSLKEIRVSEIRGWRAFYKGRQKTHQDAAAEKRQV